MQQQEGLSEDSLKFNIWILRQSTGALIRS